MPFPVVTNTQALPFGVGQFPNFTTDPGALTPPLQSEVAAKSFSSAVQFLLPNGDATLFGLSDKLSQETAAQIEHGFFAKIMVFPQFIANAAALVGATTFTSYDASNVIPNGIYMLVGTTTGGTGALTPSATFPNEQVLVTAVSGNTVTVTRGFGGSTAAAQLIDATWVHIGNAQPDAAPRPNSFLTKEIRVVNYTQIFRNSWALSGTMAEIKRAVGGDVTANSRVENMQYHAMDMEKAMFFGRRSLSNGTPGVSNALRTMNGVMGQITDAQGALLFLPGQTQAGNIVTANSRISGTPTAGALSAPDFENWASNLANMSYSPKSALSRVLFVGSVAHIVINRLLMANAQYQVENGTTMWGLRYTTITHTRISMTIIEHPLFNTNAYFSRMAIALDVSSISLAYLGKRKQMVEEYGSSGKPLGTDAGVDAIGGSLLSEMTMMCKNPAGCGMLYNITTAVGPSGTAIT